MKSIMKPRNMLLDIVRVVACFLVICAHSRMPSDAAFQWNFFIAGLGYIARPGIGLFFMVSGFLLLPTNVSARDFLKHRLGKIFYPTLIWSVLYIIENIYWGTYNTSLFTCGVSFLFHWQGSVLLWYMYTLAGLYLLSPILSPWLNNCTKRDLDMYLCLWGITLLFPYISYIAEIDTSIAGILYYFSGYVGYFILGFYLKKFGNPLKNDVIIVLVAIICLVFPIVLRLSHVSFDQGAVFGFLSIFVVAMCLVWWRFFELLAIKIQLKENAHIERGLHILSKVSVLSFGVYFIHMAVLRDVLWNLPLIKSISFYPLQTGIIIILAFVLSIVICYLISLLPFSKYLIGYSSYKRKKE